MREYIKGDDFLNISHSIERERLIISKRKLSR
jgi:hypothetical protein